MNRLARNVTAACAVAAALSAGPVGLAQQRKPAAIPQIKYSYYRLSNGLRVILSRDNRAPVVAVSVTYDVGSRNERSGRTGFAHLFEHMMFQGSENVGKGEHMMLVQEIGGTMNGSTNQDRTNYYEAVPANQLDLALFLEADRMRALDVSQANLDNQRAVVKEERRQSYDNQPYGQMGEAMMKLAYSSFGYSHSTIGSMADLNAATLEDVRSFFRTYYAPNNAALAVVGDFGEGDVRRKIERYFGAIPRGPEPPKVDVSEPPATEEKRRSLTDPLARMTRYEMAFRAVNSESPDAPVFQLLGSILGRGRNGRIYSALVEPKLALMASAGGMMGRGPGLFSFSATLNAGGDVQKVEAAFDRVIADLQAGAITDADVAKALARARAMAMGGGGGGRFGGGTQTAQGRANALSQNAIYYDDPGRMNRSLERLQGVKAADIQRVARQYFRKENRVVVVCEPETEVDYGFYMPREGSR